MILMAMMKTMIMMRLRRKGRMWERLGRTRRSPGFENTYRLLQPRMIRKRGRRKRVMMLAMMKLGHDVGKPFMPVTAYKVFSKFVKLSPYYLQCRSGKVYLILQCILGYCRYTSMCL